MERKHVNFLVVYLVTIFAIVSILDATPPIIPVPDVQFKLNETKFTVGKNVDATCTAKMTSPDVKDWDQRITFYHNNVSLGQYQFSKVPKDPTKKEWVWVTLNFTSGLNIFGLPASITNYPLFTVTLQPLTEQAKGNYHCSITVDIPTGGSAKYDSPVWSTSSAPSGGDDGKSIPWGWWFFFLFLLLSAVVGAYWLKTRYYPSRPVTGLASSGGGGNQSYENMS